MTEHEVWADEVKPGDYLPALGRVESITHYPMGRGKRVILHSEGDDWKVSAHPRHRVVVLR